MIAEFRCFSVGIQFKFLKNSTIICKILTWEILEKIITCFLLKYSYFDIFKRWFNIEFGKITHSVFSCLRPLFYLFSNDSCTFTYVLWLLALCTVTFGFMYYGLWMKSREKNYTCGSHVWENTVSIRTFWENSDWRSNPLN